MLVQAAFDASVCALLQAVRAPLPPALFPRTGGGSGGGNSSRGEEAAIEAAAAAAEETARAASRRLDPPKGRGGLDPPRKKKKQLSSKEHPVLSAPLKGGASPALELRGPGGALLRPQGGSGQGLLTQYGALLGLLVAASGWAACVGMSASWLRMRRRLAGQPVTRVPAQRAAVAVGLRAQQRAGTRMASPSRTRAGSC